VADHIVAGNAFLAEQAARFTRSEHISIIPTCVDLTRYPIAGHEPDDGLVRLVWIGSSSTMQGLEQIVPTLEQVAAAVPGVRLKLICDRFFDLVRMPVEHCRWQPATEAVELARADIGIAWMPNDDWSRQVRAEGLAVHGRGVARCGQLRRRASRNDH